MTRGSDRWWKKYSVLCKSIDTGAKVSKSIRLEFNVSKSTKVFSCQVKIKCFNVD